MKKFLAMPLILALASLSSFGSNAKAGYASQFHAPHAITNTQPHLQNATNSGRLTPPEQSKQQQAGKTHQGQVRTKAHTSAVNTIGLLSATQVPAGGSTGTTATAGDFNGDGKKDVVSVVQNGTGNSIVYSISVVLNTGNGTFSAPILTTITGNDPLLVGDLNGDGKDDIIEAHTGSPSSGTVWLSNGDGTFTQGTTYSVSLSGLQGGVLTDVNGDGKLDVLAVDTASTGLVWTLLGNGDGTFQAATSVALAGAAPSDLVFADFNGDGKIDFAGTVSGQAVVYLQSAGVFALASSLATPDSVYNIEELAAGDLTGDGKAELVSANDNGTITIYINSGNGTFQTGVYYNLNAAGVADMYPYATTLADVNGDGKLDVITSNYYGGDVSVLLGNGDGTVVVPTVAYVVGGYPEAAAVVADFNGDGLADILMTNYDFNYSYLQGYGDGTFRGALDYFGTASSTVEADSIASGDFNGDGFADFVVGTADDITLGVTVFLSRGDGSLLPGVNYGSGGDMENVVVADFNGDGKLDIAAADLTTGNIQIFTGNGDGTFTVGSSYAADAGNGAPWQMVTGDFNHDHHTDIAVVNYGNQDVGVLLNDGTGGFLAPTNYPLLANALGIAAGDINGDGYTDLLVTQADGSGIAVLLANGDNSGTFAQESAGTDINLVNGSNTYVNPQYLTIGDFNGDGKADLAVSIQGGQGSAGIAVALGNGDGTFQAPTLYQSSLQARNSEPVYVQAADINGDGKLDLVFTNSEFSTVGILFNNADGSGTFGSPFEYPSGAYPYGLAVGDVNGDGAMDVVSQSGYTGEASVLLNLNGSGTQVNFALGASTTTATVTAGTAATYNLSLTGQNGYNGTVTFSCSGLPAMATCSFAPASVVANGNLSQSTVLTINTTAATAYFAAPARPNSKPNAPTFWASMSGLGIFGLVLAGEGKKRNRRNMTIVLGVLLLVMMFALVGCSGGGSSSGGTGSTGSAGTPAGTYHVTMTGTGTGSTAPTHSMTLTLVVQ